MISKKNDHEIVGLVDDDSTDDERNIDITNRRKTNGARGDDNDGEEIECWTTNTTSSTKNPSSSNGTSSTLPKTTMSNRKDPPANNTTTSKIRSHISSHKSVDDSDDNVVIVDPPSQSSTTKISRKSGIDASTTSSSKKKNSVRGTNTPRHNSHSVLDDDDDDNDAFWTKNKPSGLTKAKTSDIVDNNNNKKRNSNSFKSTPLAGASRAESISLLHGSSRSGNIATTSEAGKQRPPSSVVRNPYEKNSTTKTPLRTSPPIRNPYEKNSTTKTPLRTSPPIRNPFEKNSTKKTPLRTSSIGNSHCSSSSSSSPLSIGSCSSKTTKIVNPYASAGKKKISTNTTPPTAKSTATQKSDRSSSASSSSIVPVAAATAAAASIRPSSSPVVDEGGICYPTLREKTKMYADKRPNIILALWKYARSNLVRDSHTMETLDRYATRIVDLAVTSHDFQIRSLGEYAFRKRTPAPKRGCGVSDLNHFNKLKESLESTKLMETRYEVGKCSDGKYFSIAEACLVAMKDMIFLRWNNRQKQQNQRTQFPSKADEQSILFSQKEYCISLVDLIPEIDIRLRPECPARLGRPKDADHGAEFYLVKSTRSIEFKQIEKLLSVHEVPDGAGTVEEMAYMKKRKVDGRVHYQLTPLGFCKAGVISRRTFPNAIGHYRSSNLKSVLPKYKGICLAVDLREGGAGQAGSRKVLHEMCDKLDMKKIPYITTTLKIGDYCFFSGDLLCPILVERKSVQDVAQSIHDGRWQSQKRRMYHGQFFFGYDNCRIAFIIEGKVEKQLVSNGFIGSAKFKVPKERFDEEIANLKSEGFDVIRTPHRDHSMFDLARWAEACAMDVQKGKLKLQFTYDEFVAEVGLIPKETDFSRLVKDHVQHKKDTETVDLLSDSDGDESGLNKKIQPIDLDETFKKNRKRPPMSTSATDNNPNTNAQKRFKLDGDKKKETIKQRNDLGETFEKNRKRPPMSISATDNNPNTSAQKCFKLNGEKRKKRLSRKTIKGMKI